MATNAQLNDPTSVFVSSNNEVYIADCSNHRIRKILQNGNIITIAGTGKVGYSGDNGLAINAQLYNPESVFVSCNNEVYIADCSNHRIRKILQNGNIVTIAGTGKPGYSGDNGPAINAQLYGPSSIFVSSNNEVYIADYHNYRIRKILQNGNIVTIAGNGKPGYSGDNGPAINAQLYNPTSVFVSATNELVFVDQNNHRIRKILQNGNIVTIAGNGKPGYSGDNGLAINAQLYEPFSVFVSSNNEVYIADYSNHRIRKILQNGNIVTIAGNGKPGYSGDNGPAINAQLYEPFSVFVSSNHEVYITDRGNHRIRKILRNGNIVTIAGNGKEGYSGDSIADLSQYPHIGGSIYTQLSNIKLKQHSRDLVKSSIYVFIPLIEILSPLFCKCILKNETLISSLNSIQKEIIQKLANSLMDNTYEIKFKSDEILNVLFIIGSFKNNEFIDLKTSLTSQFIESLTIQNLSLKWEEIEVLSESANHQFHLQNYILEYLHNYCVEFAAIQMKTTEGAKVLSVLSIVLKNASKTFSKMPLTQPTPIHIIEQIEIEPLNIEILYNDMKTSDLKIQIDENKYLYCHKTILSSSSSLFYAMFNSGSTFADLQNDIFIPDASNDLELLEIIIKTCYRIPIENFKNEKVVSLLDMAVMHEMECLVHYCANNFLLSIDNYFDIISKYEPVIELEWFKSFYNNLLQFGIQNRKKLFEDEDMILKLPQKLLVGIVKRLSQDF